MNPIWELKLCLLVSLSPCCLGLCEASLKYLHSTVRGCRLPMMHLPTSSLAQAVKEAIVSVTLRHVACTYDTEWEKRFPFCPRNVCESMGCVWKSEVLLRTLPRLSVSNVRLCDQNQMAQPPNPTALPLFCRKSNLSASLVDFPTAMSCVDGLCRLLLCLM